MKYVSEALVVLIALTAIAIGLLKMGIIGPQIDQGGVEIESESKTLETESEEARDSSTTEVETETEETANESSMATDADVEENVEPVREEETQVPTQQYVPYNTPVNTNAGTKAATPVTVEDQGVLAVESFDFSFGPQEIAPDTEVSTSCRFEGDTGNIRSVGIYIKDASGARGRVISTDNKEEMQEGISYEGTLPEDVFSFFAPGSSAVQVEAYCLAFTEGWDMTFSRSTPVTLRP